MLNKATGTTSRSDERGFRDLTPAEMELVAGGYYTDPNDIVVTAPWFDDYGDIVVEGNYDRDFYDDFFSYNYNDEDVYSGGGGGGGGGGDIADQASVALQITDAKHAVAQDLFEKYGPNLEIKFPDGSTSKITDLLDGLGKLSTGIQGGITFGEVANGDKDIRDAYHFVFGVVIADAAAQAGAGAVLSGALGFGAEAIANNMLDWMEDMGDANDQLKAYFESEVQQWVIENSDIAPGTYDNPIDLFRGMLGLPKSNWHDDNPIP